MFSERELKQMEKRNLKLIDFKREKFSDSSQSILFCYLYKGKDKLETEIYFTVNTSAKEKNTIVSYDTEFFTDEIILIASEMVESFIYHLENHSKQRIRIALKNHFIERGKYVVKNTNEYRSSMENEYIRIKRESIETIYKKAFEKIFPIDGVLTGKIKSPKLYCVGTPGRLLAELLEELKIAKCTKKGKGDISIDFFENEYAHSFYLSKNAFCQYMKKELENIGIIVW